jgi:RNA polymerase sigma-70 factor (ECF subfamily)
MENLNVLTDDMLVTRYQEGDDKAFDELLARYQSKLYNYILFAVRNQELAEDIFQ